jgi:hypothetical protein
MSSFRRFVGIATGTLVLQLTLLGAAAPCTDSPIGDPAFKEGDVTAAHDMRAPAPAGETEREDCAEHSGDPAAPGGSGGLSCIAMISCVTPLLQLGVHAPLAARVVVTDDVVAPDLEPPTRNTVPELPPPRA